MITKKERKEAEKAAKQLYQDVLSVEIQEDPDDESSLFLNITRGVRMPAVSVARDTMQPTKGKRR